jgi:hypothetical protein
MYLLSLNADQGRWDYAAARDPLLCRTVYGRADVANLSVSTLRVTNSRGSPFMGTPKSDPLPVIWGITP